MDNVQNNDNNEVHNAVENDGRKIFYMTKIEENSADQSDYDILRIEPKASKLKIRAAYRRLKKTFDPNLFSDDEKEFAKRETKRVTDAYERLVSNKTKKDRISKRLVIICVILAVTVAFLITYSFYLKNKSDEAAYQVASYRLQNEQILKELSDERNSNDKAVAQYIDTISKNEIQLNDYHDELYEYKFQVDEYKTFQSKIREMSEHDMYSDFYANPNIVILGQGESKTIHVTIKHDYATVYCDNGSAYADFMWEDFIGNSCPVRLTGEAEGVTIFSISNSANSEKIYILVLVV